MSCPDCLKIIRERDALEAECEEIARLSALQSSALLGYTQAGHPYKGKPAAPVEEAIRFRRALTLLAERLASFTGANPEQLVKDAESQAAQEMPIRYIETPPASEPEAS